MGQAATRAAARGRKAVQLKRAPSTEDQPLILHLAAVDVTPRYLLLPQLLFLREHGYRVAVCCSPSPRLEEVREAGIGVFPVPVARALLSATHVRTILALVRLLRRERVRALHVHTPVAAALGRLAARLAGTPLVFYTAHGFFFHEGMPGPEYRAHVALERLLGRWTDHLLTQSSEDRVTAVREGIVPAERCSYLGNGVDLSRFGPVGRARRDAVRKELGLGEDEVVVAFTGRLVREKGLLELMAAFQQLHLERPRVRLLLIGGTLSSDRDGQDDVLPALQQPALRHACIATGLTERVADFLAAADLFVLPSHREGMPRSILEAMAAGLAVVATDIRGCREEVVDGETGFLVPVGDAVRLGRALARLVDDPALRNRMGARGRERAQRLFDERLVFARLLELYDRYPLLKGTS